MQVTAEAARRFLVTRQFLAPARSLEGGPAAVMDVVARLGSLQYDPIAIAGRSHDLVLHARVAGYEAAWVDRLYGPELFEAYNKGLSFVPVAEFPLFRGGWSEHGRRVIAGNPDVARRVLERIRADGPLSALDFERERGPVTDWFGIPTNTVRAVLEAYATTGELGLARRDGNRRYYDVIERLLPAEIVARDVPLRERLRHKMLSRYRAHGLLGATAGNDIFSGLGPAKPDPGRPDIPGRHALRDELIDSGELVPVQVEGVGTRFVVRDEVADVEAPPEPPPAVALISPFDPLVWERSLLGSLFGFDYVWELFIPPARRRWGWYVLPMLFRDRFVGRIEPRIDREQSRVDILDLWWEHGFAPAKEEGFVDAMRDALRAYLRFARRRDSSVAGAPRPGEEALARFVLIHGAWHGGWCWAGVVEALEARGHSTWAPDLPCEQVGLTQRDYAEMIGPQPDAIVVGHSWGAQTPGLVDAPVRVYLAGLLPVEDPSPECFAPGFGGTLRDELDRSYWPDADTCAEKLYPDCTRDVSDWAFAQLRRQARSAEVTVPLRPDDVVIATMRDQAIDPGWQIRMAERHGTRLVRIDAGHSPFLTQPEELAGLLSSLA